MADSRVAVHGAGHLTAALVEGFSRAHTAPVSIYNRTPQRARGLARVFPILRVFEDQAAFDSEKCPLLLVIPGRALLEALHAGTERLKASGRVVVSCANGLPLPVLEQRFPGIPWIKAIPNVAAAVGKSVTLMAKSAATGEADFRAVQQILGSVGTVFRVQDDEEMDRLAVVTSCLPGLLGGILDEFAQTYELDETQTRELLIESALGSLGLAKRNPAGLQGLVASVCNPGGLTETGVVTIRKTLPPLLAELRNALDRKQERRRQQYLALH